MPNWCNNYLSLEGNKETIAEIKRILRKPFIKPESSQDVIKRKEIALQECSPEDVMRITHQFDAKISELVEAEKMYDLRRSEPGVFRRLIGIHPDVPVEDYVIEGWYNANCDYWGCKWDVEFDEDMWDMDDDDCMTGSFDTAWSPPVAFCNELFEKFPGITLMELTYEEGGCDFCGKTTYERYNDGQTHIEEESYPYEKGLYILQTDYFWSRLADEMEYALENENTLEDIKERFQYVTENDMNEIIEVYESVVHDLKHENDEA